MRGEVGHPGGLTLVPALSSPDLHEPLLVNTIGHCVGAVIFAIFIYLLIRDRGLERAAGRRSLLAAALALVWNVTSLAAIPTGSALMIAAGSSALSLMPAVLLHISPAGKYRWIILPGYVLAAAAVAIHMEELAHPAPAYHRLALNLITVGFGALTAVAAVPLFASTHGLERRRLLSPLLGTMALFLFALSFVHFGGEGQSRTWPVEMVLHHAGIPLALVVLLQDYRFLLLDAFLRFLANIALAGGLTFLALRAAQAIGIRIDFGGSEFRQGLLLVAACLALIVFAMLRERLQRALTRVLFRRRSLAAALERLRTEGPEEEAGLLEAAARVMAEFMEAKPVEAPSREASLEMRFPTVKAERGMEVLVPVRLPNSETHVIALGRRRGGRRYLSEDLRALAQLSSGVTERLERLRKSEMERLVAEAELRALHSQIHPHFLFNALNTLYGVIPKQAADARRLVLNLADIFRYFLQTERNFIPLEEELHIVRAYLEIEGQRLGPKLRCEIDADAAVLHTPIPILSVEPLVENAVKHGVAATAGGGTVRVVAKPDARGVTIRVEDTGRGFASGADSSGPGVGLRNVERRLRLCYGESGALRIESSSRGTTVEFLVPSVQEAAAR